jgi:hypothetical protein
LICMSCAMVATTPYNGLSAGASQPHECAEFPERGTCYVLRQT